MSEGLLTYGDLAKRWDCCERQAKRICRNVRLKAMDLGHRTKRFRPVDVDRAEQRLVEGRRARS